MFLLSTLRNVLHKIIRVLINFIKLVYGTKLYRFYQIRKKFSYLNRMDLIVKYNVSIILFIIAVLQKTAIDKVDPRYM